jgi:serine/threonine-protein kinase
LLFALLTCRPPFGGDASALSRQHRLSAPPRLREFRPEAPRELDLLAARLLAKEPLRRPSSAELIRWLTEIEIAELAV